MPLNGIPPLAALQNETIWLDAGRYQDAERRYHEISAPENLNGARPRPSSIQKNSNSSTGSQQSTSIATPSSSLASEIAQARQKIQNFLKSGDYESDFNKNILNRLQILEEEKERMGQRLNEMHNMINTVMKQIAELDLSPISKTKVDQHKKQDKPSVNGPSAAAANNNDDDDDDVDLFGSDEETEEDIKLKQERVKAYENKKSKKPALVAKSSVVLDVKPWSDETDMKELEIGVRKIQLDGLNWGASKLVPLAYGIKKLQIIAIVEDEKVSIDELQESIEKLDDLVQSVDIAAFNKL